MAALTFWPIEPGLLIPFNRPAGDRTIVTPMEDGPPSARRRNLGAPGRYEGELVLTGEQYVIFWDWGTDMLLDWSLPFLWRDPMEGDVRRMLFKGAPARRGTSVKGAGMDPSLGTYRLAMALWVLE